MEITAGNVVAFLETPAHGEPIEFVYHATKRLNSSTHTEVWLVGDADGQSYVLKVYGTEADAADPDSNVAPIVFDREGSCLKLLAGAEIPGRPRPFPDLLKSGSVGSRPAIVQSLVPGQDLESWLRLRPDRSRLNWVVRSIGTVVDLCHSQRVLHADISMRNVLVDDSDNAYLVDFNISKLRQHGLTTTSALRFPGDTPPSHPLNLNTLDQEELLDAAIPLVDLFLLGRLLKEVTARREVARALGNDAALWETFTRDTAIYARASKWRPGDLGRRIDALLSGSRALEVSDPNPGTTTVNIAGYPVPLAPRIAGVVDSAIFARMRQLRQLSLVRYVHAGAEHSRWEHMVHTYDLARRLVQSLLQTPTFRLYMDAQAQRQLLGVALLHDINHFPFMHYLQESLPMEIDDRWIVESLVGSSGPQIHELLAELDLTVELLCGLTFGKHSAQAGPVDQIVSSVVNSAVDVDKMSYLLLDSRHCGVGFGVALEVETLTRLASVDWVEGDRLHVVYDERAIPAIDALLVARASMFQSVYWHRVNRSMACMVWRDFATITAATEDQRKFYRTFLAETYEGGEHVALTWLNNEHKSRFGTESISARLAFDRNSVYRRLLSLKPESSRETDSIVRAVAECLQGKRGNELLAAELLLLERVRAQVALMAGTPVEASDVVIDVPRRRTELERREESVFIRTSWGTRRYQEVMGVGGLPGDANLRRIRRHVRLFIHPRLFAPVQRAWREDSAARLATALQASTGDVASSGLN